MAVAPHTIFKPNDPGAVDWGNPITKGLVFYCIFNAPVPIDLVTGRPATRSGTPTQRATVDGSAANIESASSQYFEFSNPQSWNVNVEKTIFWRGSLATASRYHFLIGNTFSDAGSGTSFSLETNNNAGSPTFVYTSAAASYKNWQGPAIPLNQMVSLSVDAANVDATPTFWKDGVATTGSGGPFGGGGSGATTGSGPYRVGRRPDGGPQLNGLVSVAAVWNRKLSPAETLIVHKNPFSLLVPSGIRTRRNAQAATGYTLTAEAGSFTLTGNATGLTAARLLTGGTGAFTETGNATGLAAARLLTAEAQSYVLTGNATGLAYGRTMAADVGDFTLTGVDAALSRSRVLQADTGEFVLTGNATSLAYSGAATAAGGSVGKARRRRKARDEVEGNRDFTPKRNSRPGVAEEEMREVLAEVRAKMPVTVPLDAIEDDDEEAILWLI